MFIAYIRTDWSDSVEFVYASKHREDLLRVRCTSLCDGEVPICDDWAFAQGMHLEELFWGKLLLGTLILLDLIGDPNLLKKPDNAKRPAPVLW